jgi:hypothetical protein
MRETASLTNEAEFNSHTVCISDAIQRCDASRASPLVSTTLRGAVGLHLWRETRLIRASWWRASESWEWHLLLSKID